MLPNLTNSQEPEPGVFGSLEPEPLGKKIGSRSRLKKKSGAAKKFADSPALPIHLSLSIFLIYLSTYIGLSA